MSKILIVGGVAGGASAAARLRRLDEKAELIMFERGEYISFANCGLPYYIGGEITDRAALTLQTPESFNSRFNVDVRVLNEVIDISPKDKSVTVKNHKTGDSYTESYDKLIISTGAEPIKPDITGIDNDKVFTLRNIPDTYRIKDYIDSQKPNKVCVVGGGYIGVEMAENLHMLGLEVTLVQLMDQIIDPLDYEMACAVQQFVTEKGIKLILSNAVTAIESQGSGLRLTLQDGELACDMVIMSVGVRPESGVAKDAGIALNGRGSIIVDAHMQTSDPDIYAVGDVVEITNFVTKEKGFVPLAGPANHQGRIVADNICGIKSSYKGTQGSSILKVFDMTVATTGVNERAAKNARLSYDKVYNYPPSHATYYPGANNMMIKTIFEKGTGKILGAQIVGFDGVDKRCDVLATAIRAKMTYADLIELELSYAPPFSSAKDPVNMVGYMIENLILGKSKNFYWDDAKKLPRDGSVNLIDVRGKDEFDPYHLDGFKNIPLDELRDRFDEIDKSLPVYLICHSGQRSYVAARILNQNGFDAYNLSGGIQLYYYVYGTDTSADVLV